MTVKGMTIVNAETRAVCSPVSGLTGGFSWFSLLLWGLDMVSRERHGSIQLPSDANKGVASCNTGRERRNPNACRYRRPSQATVAGWRGVDNHRGHTERLGKESDISGRDGDGSGSERCARGDLASPSNKRTDNGPRKTHGRCRKAPREVEPFAWLGAPGTEALLRGQHSEGNVWNVLSRRLRGQYSEGNV